MTSQKDTTVWCTCMLLLFVVGTGICDSSSSKITFKLKSPSPAQDDLEDHHHHDDDDVVVGGDDNNNRHSNTLTLPETGKHNKIGSHDTADFSSRSHRIKRSASTSNDVCPPQQDLNIPSDLSSASKVNTFAPPKHAENSFDTISMMWTGVDNATRVVGLMHRYRETSSTVYVSKSSATMIDGQFELVTELENVTISMMERNPTDLTHVIIIGTKDDSYQSCVSKDAGVSYTCNAMIDSYAPAGTLMFKDHLVMTILKSKYFFEDDIVLVLSSDYGETWKAIHHDVTAAVFQPGDTNTIFALVSVEDSNPYPGFQFLFQSPATSQMRKIDVSKPEPSSAELSGLKKTAVTGFQFIGKFLHVVTQDDDGHKVLKVSTDNGVTFTDSHLPTTISGQYIHLLDTADELTFAHVTSATDSSIGTLYTSGQGGLLYTKSLERHISDDFYKVTSMHGVYLTTQKGEDNSLISLISLDRGAVWSPITVKNCKQDDCTLQIYNTFLIEEHKRTTSQEVLAQTPHSNENARGLIVVQGFLARSIPYSTGLRRYTYEAENVGVFISGDGGYSWIQAPESDLVGAHHLLIEDSGGVIQALPMDKPLETILFSVNEGTCWYKFPVEDNIPKDFTIRGLASQPGQQSLRLGIIGHTKVNSNQTTWLIIDVDFEAVIPKLCVEDEDFKNWDAYPQCYLGMKRIYRRVKTTSWCHLGPDMDVSSQNEICPCSRKDYECDYGFVKEDSTENCVKDPEFKDEVTYCLDNKVYELISSGYRLLPGDVCDKEAPTALKIDTAASSRDMKQPCDEGDPSTYLDVALVKTRICGTSSTSDSSGQSQHGSNQGLVAAIVILTLISTIFCVAFATFFIKYRTLRRQYDYSAFENYSWDANTSDTPNPSGSSSKGETSRIADLDNAGRSYTTLREPGTESDVDLLNL